MHFHCFLNRSTVSAYLPHRLLLLRKPASKRASALRYREPWVSQVRISREWWSQSRCWPTFWAGWTARLESSYIACNEPFLAYCVSHVIYPVDLDRFSNRNALFVSVIRHFLKLSSSLFFGFYTLAVVYSDPLERSDSSLSGSIWASVYFWLKRAGHFLLRISSVLLLLFIRYWCSILPPNCKIDLSSRPQTSLIAIYDLLVYSEFHFCLQQLAISCHHQKGSWAADSHVTVPDRVVEAT